MDIYNCCLQNFIRYDNLYAMTMREFRGSTANEVNIWIDANSAIGPAFIYNEENTPTYKSYNVFAAMLINMAAHYRNYFKTRHRTYAYVYIVFGNNWPRYVLESLPSYNAHHVQRYRANLGIYDVWKKSIEALDMLCPYIPGVYFLNAENNEVGTVIAEMVPRDAKKLPNIIISRDPFMYLVVDRVQRTCCYRPKKSMNADTSYLINKQNLIQTYPVTINQRPIKGPVVADPGLFSTAIVHSGLKCRDVNGVMQYKSAVDIGRRPFFFTSDEEELIARNTKILSIDWQVSCLRMEPIYSTMFSGLKDLYDPDSMKDINNRYYEDYPLDLNAL